MVAYSFKRQFAEPIILETKGGTIRATGKRRHARPGEEIQCYTAMRTKHCRLITRKTCLETAPIRLSFSDDRIVLGSLSNLELPRVAPRELAGGRRLDVFARFDGFPDWAALRAFWREEHEALRRWRGVHVRWLPLPEELLQ